MYISSIERCELEIILLFADTLQMPANTFISCSSSREKKSVFNVFLKSLRSKIPFRICYSDSPINYSYYSLFHFIVSIYQYLLEILGAKLKKKNQQMKNKVKIQTLGKEAVFFFLNILCSTLPKVSQKRDSTALLSAVFSILFLAIHWKNWTKNKVSLLTAHLILLTILITS